VRLAFAGTPDVAVPTLDALVAAGHDVVGVVTRPDAPAGRGKRLTPSPVAVRAQELGLEVLKPERPRDAEFVARLSELNVDAVPVVAYGALLPESVLAIPRLGWVNLHFSLLPRWRGAAPAQRSIMAGDTIGGATTFRIVKALDAGPVYRTLETPIDDSTTSGELLDRLARLGGPLMVETVELMAAGVEPVPQDEAGLTLAPKITVEEAQIDWSRPARELVRHIHGCSPDPGAWTLFRGERLKIDTAHVSDDALPPGELVATKRTVTVGTAAGALVLDQVRPQGKKPMPAADWARGVRIEDGERLG